MAGSSLRVLLRARCLDTKWYAVQPQTAIRTFFCSGRRMGLDEDFVSAKERLNALKEDPGNEVKLQIYALFKQATVGKCNTPKPGMMDFVGKYKWEAWNTLGDMSQDEAKSKYIEVVQGLAAAEGDTSPQVADTESAGTAKYKELTVHRDGKMFVITLNRPKKKNAINYQMYEEWGLALAEAAESDATIAVVTGAGDYYCSGNDLSNFMNIPPDGIAAMAEEGGRILKKFVSAFIDFPKPLLAAVNGPAVGVSVTVLGLFDIVYATDTATFHTPFSALGQSPEGCSSLTFPQIMGTAKANEMLLFNRKLTAAEAMERGLVTEVFPEHSFQTEVWARLREMAKLPPVSLRTSKGLIRDVDRAALHATNQRECDLLVDRWQSDECMNAIMNFFQQKAKL